MPIVKRREGEKVEDYRGVTLMPSLYKVYISVLEERLKEEMEKMIPPNHTGFRKGIGTIDNIYVLNYIINKRLGKKKGKVVAMLGSESSVRLGG